MYVIIRSGAANSRTHFVVVFKIKESHTFRQSHVQSTASRAIIYYDAGNYEDDVDDDYGARTTDCIIL